VFAGGGPTNGADPWERIDHMEVFEAVRTLLAVREYDNRPVPEETIRRIVEAGRLTGSSMNGQPRQFIVVQDPATLQQLGSLARSGGYTARAPMAIVVLIENSRFAISDASRSIEAMLLTAWSEGVGGNWVGFGGLDGVKSLLGIPAELDILAILPMGYPARDIGKGKKKRKNLAEVAHRERFGQPFE
jgi:nitroreductase